MNERQATAIRQLESACRALESASGVRRPDLAYASRHNEQETTVVLERLAAFLRAVEGDLGSVYPNAPETAQKGSDVLTAIRGASVEELMSIPHIGASTAQKIKAALA